MLMYKRLNVDRVLNAIDDNGDQVLIVQDY